jgi:hypothetical protein
VRFNSEVYQGVLKALNCKLRMSTQRHPQTDGMSESAVKKVIAVLRSITADSGAAVEDWPEWLGVVELCINTSLNAATDMSPFEAELGFNPLLPIDLAIGPQLQPSSSKQKKGADIAQQALDRHAVVREAVLQHQLRMEQNSAATAQPKPFEPGDLVLVKSTHLRQPGSQPSKLAATWSGPFHVLERVGDSAYRLQLRAESRAHDVINREALRPFHTDPFKRRPPALTDDEGEVRYIVEEVLGEVKEKGKTKYVTKWLGYGETTNEPLDNLLTSDNLPVEALQRYLDKKNAPPAEPQQPQEQQKRKRGRPRKHQVAGVSE